MTAYAGFVDGTDLSLIEPTGRECKPYASLYVGGWESGVQETGRAQSD